MSMAGGAILLWVRQVGASLVSTLGGCKLPLQARESEWTPLEPRADCDGRWRRLQPSCRGALGPRLGTTGPRGLGQVLAKCPARRPVTAWVASLIVHHYFVKIAIGGRQLSISHLLSDCWLLTPPLPSPYLRAESGHYQFILPINYTDVVLHVTRRVSVTFWCFLFTRRLQPGGAGHAAGGAGPCGRGRVRLHQRLLRGRESH